MAIDKATQPNIDLSNLGAYPDGQIKDDSGTNDGTAVARITISDQFEFFAKLMRLAALTYNASYDNEVNGYQYVQALIALAGKNDYVLPLTSSVGILQLPTDLDILNNGEILFGRAAADYASETQIKGSTATLLSITVTSQYKNNDYLLLINIGGAISIVRLTTADNFNTQAVENAFLKAVSNATELAGSATNGATTPASNLYAFTQRVTDPTNATPFLATDTTPGIMSAADKYALDHLSSPIKNVGSMGSIQPGGSTVGASAPVTGQITSAIVEYNHYDVNHSISGYLVTIPVAMANTNYYVMISLRSNGTITADCGVVGTFKPVSTTQFKIYFEEIQNGTRDVTAFLQVIQA